MPHNLECVHVFTDICMLRFNELVWELNTGGKGSQTNPPGDRSVSLNRVPASTSSLWNRISQAGLC